MEILLTDELDRRISMEILLADASLHRLPSYFDLLGQNCFATIRWRSC